MPTVLYIRGAPGTGKNTVARILERDLHWPRLWCHQFDSIYKVIGEYKVPDLTDKLMLSVAEHLMTTGRDFMAVRPSRSNKGILDIWEAAKRHEYTFIVVKLEASYRTMVTRVTRRWAESPFRLTTKEKLDEYLNERPEEVFHATGQYVVPTDDLTPEQVAGRIKELLPPPILCGARHSPPDKWACDLPVGHSGQHSAIWTDKGERTYW